MRLRTDDSIQQLIHRHYDLYPHSASGPGSKTCFCYSVTSDVESVLPWHWIVVSPIPFDLVALPALPIDVLQADWWVPGSTTRSDSPKFQNAPVFKEVLATTPETCRTWVVRATEDSCSYFHRLKKVELTFAEIWDIAPWTREDFKRRVSPTASTKSKDRGFVACTKPIQNS